MMNNPMLGLVQMFNQGQNPMSAISSMMSGNPRLAQVMSMVNGKSPDQLRAMAVNMCRERGTTPEQVAQALGMNALK